MKKKMFLLSALLALVFASTATAGTIFGPRISAKAAIVNDRVNVTLKVTPHYRSSKPGVLVTLSHCATGQTMIKAVEYPGLLPGGEKLGFGPNKVLWSLSRVPALPHSATLRLALALPQGKGGPTFCVRVALTDHYTGRTAAFELELRIPALTGSPA